jgi:hypothetical protein
MTRRSRAQEPLRELTTTLVPTMEEPTVYVHLCSGEVIPVSPATSISVRRDCVEVCNEGRSVVTYLRSQVYFCSKVETPTFIA